MPEDLPIYERIKKELKGQIDSGTLAEGAPVPSENELCERLGVSRQQTRQALRELELEGYVVRSQGRRSVVAPASSRPRSLPVDGAKTVAIALQSQDSRFTRRVFRGFIRQVSEAGYQSIAYNLLFDPEQEVAFLQHIQGTGVAGLVLWLQNDIADTRRLLDTFREARFPVVLVDRYLKGVDLDFVVTDSEAVGYQLTRRLIERGHEHIGWISDPHWSTSHEDRFRGYRRALEEAGLPYEETFSGALHAVYGSAADTVRSIMSCRTRPTAFFSIHDSSAKPLVEELGKMGYRIPQDVEVACLEDEGVAEELGVPMLSLRQRPVEMGRLATECLLARIGAPERPAQQHFLEAEQVPDKGYERGRSISAAV